MFLNLEDFENAFRKLFGSSSRNEDKHDKPKLSDGLKRLQDTQGMFVDAFSDMSNTCNNAATYAYVSSICKDFSPSKWNDFYGVLQSCSDPYSSKMQSPDDLSAWSESGTTNDGNSNSDFKECMKGKVSGDNVPGGINAEDKNKDITMFGFLDPRKNQIITFASHAPVSMAYSTTVSDSISFSSSFTQKDPFGWDIGFDASDFVPTPFVGVGGSINAGAHFSNDVTIEIGKSSSSSHSNSRDVSIFLDDDQTGIH